MNWTTQQVTDSSSRGAASPDEEASSIATYIFVWRESDSNI